MKRVRLTTESAFRFALASLRRRLVGSVLRKAGTKGYPKLLCIPSDVIGREIVMSGLYEEGLLRALFDVAFERYRDRFEGGIAIDVGANIGNHACFMARYFRRVAAFEPNPTARNILAVNVDLNGLSNVDIFGCGLSDSEGLLPFRENAANNLGGSRFLERGAVDATQELEVKRGDAVIQSRYGDDPITLVKLDVEGHELKVIEGLRETLARHRPLVLFESHTSEGPSGSKAITSYLAGLGYAFLYSVEPRAAGQRLGALRKLARLRYGGSYYLQRLAEPENRPYELLLAAEKSIEGGDGQTDRVA